MFQKLLVVCVLALSFSTAFAKSANKRGHTKGAQKVASLKFDYEAFKKMNAKDKYAYVKAIKDAVVQISALQPKGKKSAMFDLQQLLIPYAEADAKRCWNGGIAYMAESCDPRTSPIPENPASSAFTTCASGESRCSSALGLNIVDGKAVGACYKTSDYNRATSICEGKLGGNNGIANLVSALTTCQSQATANGVDCNKIKQAVLADTAGIDDFCANSNYAKGTCARVQANVAEVRRRSGADVIDPASPIVDAPQGAVSCAAVAHKVASDAVKKAMGQGVDPKWMRMIMMTEKACGLGNFDITKQFKKFGVCKSNEGPSQASPATESAIAKVMSGGSLSPTEVGHFRDYFGVSPTEYKNVFCRSTDSLKFAENMSKLASGGDGPAYNRQMANYILGMKPTDYRAFVAKMDTSKLPAKLSADVTKYGEVRAQQEQYQTTLALAEAKLVTNPDDFQAKKDKADAKAALYTINSQAAGLKSGLEFDLARVTPRRGTPLRMALDDNEFEDLRKKFDEHNFAQQLSSGGITTEGLKERKELMACAASAVKVDRKEGDDFNPETVSAKSNFDSTCWSQKLKGKAADMFVTTFGSFMIESLDGKSCFYSDGSTSADASCKPTGRALNMTPGDALNLAAPRGNTPKCLDGLESSYVISEMSCAAPVDRGTFECADGFQAPVNADGEWSCTGHGGNKAM